MFRHGCGNSEAQPFLGRSFPGDGFGFSGPSFYFRALIIFMVGVELDFFLFIFFNFRCFYILLVMWKLFLHSLCLDRSRAMHLRSRHFYLF